MKKKALVILAIIVAIVAILAVKIGSGFVGYKGTVRKIVNAYRMHDPKVIDEVLSGFYADDSAEFFYDNISNDLEEFDEFAGEKDYTIGYKICNSSEIAKEKYEEMLSEDLNDHGFDADIISKAMVVEVDVIQLGNGIDTKTLTLTLTKENGSWKLFNMSY